MIIEESYQFEPEIELPIVIIMIQQKKRMDLYQKYYKV